ncbi:hypothetical protein BDV26DRAFT_300157 [Aspergillus bertholletiae]|uniref:Uncharacterized protein n=1 Tax=Aspergillus bertholletiae TaxID=1226010 RepID=A0A5N7BK01_9EURO|nr:hypothetical protein BDV26DRAFT_300157 [Aspergillus bertholletiae]
MAGIKRKLDSTKGSAAVPTGSTTGAGAPPKTPNSTVGDTAHIRVTRSLRASQDARANQTDNNKNSTNILMHNKSSNNRPLSRIITLSTRAARANSAARNALNSATNNGTNSLSNAARETRASRTRAAAPTTVAAPTTAPAQSHLDGTSLNVPETPRSKRVRRGPVVEETPRSTRQSARLRSHVSTSFNESASSELAITKQFEASPSKGVTPSSRTRNRSRQAVDVAPDATQSTLNSNVTTEMRPRSPEDIIPETVERLKQTEGDEDPHEPAEFCQAAGELSADSMYQEEYHETNETNIQEIEGMPSPAKTSCSSGSQKRRSSEPENKGTTEFSSTLDLPSQRLKLEDGELDRTVEQSLQGSTDIKNVSNSPDDEVEESKAGDESRQITEDIEESTPENTTEPTVGKAVRGGRSRGRGRGGRSRAAARSGSNKRGRGGTRAARGGRTGRQYDRSSDVEHDRSPSPSAATQKLRDRQRELDKAFRKVAAAQRLALAVLASQSQKKLSRDKNAHKNVPEYEEINSLLKTRLERRLEVFRHEYELRVEQENKLFAAKREAVEERFRVSPIFYLTFVLTGAAVDDKRLQASARYIKEEHFFASQGEYMAFVEGRRAAEDDEHTEVCQLLYSGSLCKHNRLIWSQTDGSEAEPERIIPPAKEVVRGFNSSFVRNPAGAASYDRARYGWDDFVQRAKLGDDIDPQMKEMREAGPFAGFSAREIIDLLLEATGIVEVRQKASVENQLNPVFPDARPTALFALADVAAAELPRPTLSQTTPRLSAHRALLPQPSQVAHGPTDPRSFVLPPPTPQRQQPRRLLPAGQQIPPISEQLGLPDPFASRGGPPQLPPPPGSNFQRPPLPNYLAGHHPQSLYYPPPPPPTAPPPGPRPPY